MQSYWCRARRCHERVQKMRLLILPTVKTQKMGKPRKIQISRFAPEIQEMQGSMRACVIFLAPRVLVGSPAA
jgi:hypothetical protein